MKKIMEKAEDGFLQLIVFGLGSVTGPIDDEDRARATKLLRVTETREAIKELIPNGVTDEEWEIILKRRSWAEKILQGILEK